MRTRRNRDNTPRDSLSDGEEMVVDEEEDDEEDQEYEELDESQYSDEDDEDIDPSEADCVFAERERSLDQILQLSSLQVEQEEDAWAEKAASLLPNGEAEDLIRKMIIVSHGETRPKNTSKTYGQFQKKYKKWCERIYEGDDTVNQEKAVRFIVEEYVGRRTARGTIHRSSTIGAVCNSLVDLFQDQVASGKYPNAHHPRGATMNQLIKVQKLRTAEIDRVNLADRAEGTIEDGYDYDQMVAMLSDLLSGDSESPMHLRTRLTFLLGHSALFRGCNTRSLELADLSCTVTKTTDPTPLVVYNMLTQHGKTNQMGRKDFSATIRHKDPKICLVNALAMFLFFRFQMTHEGLPDMTSRKS
ncbi:hypothetical protein TRICI_005992, partial [Trichomonascus ciferrii]